ncbi:MAG TPA: MerR family DNA-binding transcriptional regulator [Vitreimonas sp.]|uniref:MerR family transcriptional regulator n=1 Tax=Vitreimonas sp. TaxID=3069702 RepID=UPI002D5A938E|nr:MerR family DNA-binding transcriptional regulator [Vitreimonas sp.]HYD86541.1 MerR family DNA-binding transcriptional regulator [Vitreimonas sp.]
MTKTERTYTISQLAREFDVTPRALRFYEDKGLLTPRRDGMNRVYSHRDRARLQLILRGKRVGLSLIEIKEILDLYKVDQRAQAQTALKKYKARIVALEAQREDIDAAIETLTDSIAKLEKFLAKPAAPAAMGAARAFEAEAKKRLEEVH